MRPTGSGSSSPADERLVGPRLQSHRRRAGLSGHQLADLVGMTQSKISRIETGAVLPDPAAVRRIADALNLPPEVVEQLVDDADGEHNRMQDLRTDASAVVTQRQIAELEQKSKFVRLFNPTTIPGLLQTGHYATAVIISTQTLGAAPGKVPPESELMDAAAARIRRREVLQERATRVAIVMSEAALANRVADDHAMLQQIEFIQELAATDRFRIRILPFTQRLPGPLSTGFEVADERWVVIDLFNTAVTSPGAEDVRRYIRVFDELWEAATAEVEPILAEYARRYKSSTG